MSSVVGVTSGPMIKVVFRRAKSVRGLPDTERLWAEQVSKNTAKIQNSPVTTGQVAHGDLVRIDKNREIVKVLERVARTRLLIYNRDGERNKETLQMRCQEIHKHLKKHNIVTEGAFLGLCSLAVPLTIDDKKLAELAAEVKSEILVPPDGPFRKEYTAHVN